MARYEKVGGGSYGVYREKSPKLIWGVLALFFLIAMFSDDKADTADTAKTDTYSYSNDY